MCCGWLTLCAYESGKNMGTKHARFTLLAYEVGVQYIVYSDPVLFFLPWMSVKYGTVSESLCVNKMVEIKQLAVGKLACWD